MGMINKLIGVKKGTRAAVRQGTNARGHLTKWKIC